MFSCRPLISARAVPSARDRMPTTCAWGYREDGSEEQVFEAVPLWGW
jgi:hypothetical protein